MHPSNLTLRHAAAYKPTSEQLTFFKRETGIDDDDELRSHIIKVQEIACKIFSYPCIRLFWFLQQKIAMLPAYDRIIKLGQERPDGILIDIGSCFGVDARKAVADGFSLKNIVTTDVHKEFFDLGHTLFNTTPATYPLNFIPGDALDPDMLQIVPPFDKPPLTARPNLSALTSLNPLVGHCTVVYANSFFHLFSEEQQLLLAKAFAGLLSSEPGSMICGGHLGHVEKGVYYEDTAGRKNTMFKHSPESWSAMWDGEVFAKGNVRVEVVSEWLERPGCPRVLWLKWSVVRL